MGSALLSAAHLTRARARKTRRTFARMEERTPELVIAMVGSFGSGCTYIADNHLVPAGFEKVSLSDILREEYSRRHGKSNPARAELQGFGSSIRREKGSDYLAREACRIIQVSRWKRVVVDSVRNPGEIRELKRVFANVIVVGVFATTATRWSRVRARYGGDLDAFLNDDRVDRDEGVDYGQRVTSCFLLTDYVIQNEDMIDSPSSPNAAYLQDEVERLLKLVASPGCMPPAEEEALMAMAYANGQRSSCVKRKVGAVIVDQSGHILSSGYNEVPGMDPDNTCRTKHGACYRDLQKADFDCTMKELDLGTEKSEAVRKVLWAEFKILDRCRALHAEELAIINLTKAGARLPQKTRMFVTTYPCNLCANKIVEVGIKDIIYFEPYPVRESVEILNRASVNQLPFRGVTFNGYFRLFGGGGNAKML